MPVDIAAFTDEEVARFKADIEEQIRRLMEAIRKELENAPLDEAGKIVPSRNLELLRQVTANLVRDYDEMFRTALSDSWRQVAARMVQAVSSDMQEQGISGSFTTAGADALLAMVDGTLRDIATIGGKGADELRRIVESLSLTPISPGDLLTELQGKLESSLAEVLNLVDTAVMGLDRETVIRTGRRVGLRVVPVRWSSRWSDPPMVRRAGWLSLSRLGDGRGPERHGAATAEQVRWRLALSASVGRGACLAHSRLPAVRGASVRDGRRGVVRSANAGRRRVLAGPRKADAEAVLAGAAVRGGP
jgi:hypothetical protein